MNARGLLNVAITGLLLGGLSVAQGPGVAGASNMWHQQVIPVVHGNVFPVGGLTTNYTITATKAPVTVNIKCFNDQSQRVGPVGGVDIPLASTGQVAFATPSTLMVTTDPLFTGAGWCWANNVLNDEAFSVQVVVGHPADFGPNGILTSPSTFVAAGTGLTETSSGHGGVPYFSLPTQISPLARFLTILVLVNPLPADRVLTLRFYDVNGVAPGEPFVLSLAGRGLQLLTIAPNNPASGLPGTFPPSVLPKSLLEGSLTIVADGNGYLGWMAYDFPSLPNPNASKLVAAPIGLNENDRALLTRANAP